MKNALYLLSLILLVARPGHAEGTDAVMSAPAPTAAQALVRTFRVLGPDLASLRDSSLNFLALPMTSQTLLVEEKPVYARRLADELRAAGWPAARLAEATASPLTEKRREELKDALKAAAARANVAVLREMSDLSGDLDAPPDDARALRLLARARPLLEDGFPFLTARERDQLHLAVLRGEAVEKSRKAKLEKFSNELPGRIARGEIHAGTLFDTDNNGKWRLTDRSAFGEFDTIQDAVDARLAEIKATTPGPWSGLMLDAVEKAVALHRPLNAGDRQKILGSIGAARKDLAGSRMAHRIALDIDAPGIFGRKRLSVRAVKAWSDYYRDAVAYAPSDGIRYHIMAAIQGAMTPGLMSLDSILAAKNAEARRFYIWYPVAAFGSVLSLLVAFSNPFSPVGAILGFVGFILGLWQALRLVDRHSLMSGVTVPHLAKFEDAVKDASPTAAD